MTLVAVSCRSCMGQSRKDRSALVPTGTTIFSCITEFKLISQYDSGFLFSICRLNPSSFRRSTVQRSEQNRKMNSMLFISNLEAWNIQGTKLTLKTQKQWFQTQKLVYRFVFFLTWSRTPEHLHVEAQGKPRNIWHRLCITVGQSQAEISLFVSRLSFCWGHSEWRLVSQSIITRNSFLLAFWWSVMLKANSKIVHRLNSKVPLHFLFIVVAFGVIWSKEINRKRSSGQLDIHLNYS